MAATARVAALSQRFSKQVAPWLVRPQYAACSVSANVGSTGPWPAVCGHRRMSTASLATADGQLDSFAEAQEAQSMLSQGRGTAAASLLMRVVGICEAATGSGSHLTLAAQRRCAARVL